MDAQLPRDVAFLLALALLLVLTLQILWLTGGRERLARLSDAVLTRRSNVSGGPFVVRSSDRDWARARHRELEEELAAAHSEIERLRARLAMPAHKPTSVAQMRAEAIATVRQRRLWIARGGDRHS